MSPFTEGEGAIFIVFGVNPIGIGVYMMLSLLQDIS